MDIYKYSIPVNPREFVWQWMHI